MIPPLYHEGGSGSRGQWMCLRAGGKGAVMLRADLRNDSSCPSKLHLRTQKVQFVVSTPPNQPPSEKDEGCNCSGSSLLTDSVFSIHLLANTYLLPQSIPSSFTVTGGHAQTGEKCVTWCLCSQLRWNKATVLFHFTINRCPFGGLFRATFLTFLCFFGGVIMLFTVAGEWSAAVLSVRYS